MQIAFLETRDFSAVREIYFAGDGSFRHLQNFIAENPERGAVIPGTNGLRKLRWPDPRRGKGKRGGLRLIYLYIPLARFVILLDVYDKNESDDLSPAEKKVLANVANQIREKFLTERNLKI